MGEIFNFIIGVIAGAGIVWFLYKFVRKEKYMIKMKKRQGIFDKQVAEKEKNRQKITEMLKKNDRICNDDVEKALKVSDATATRYLDELQKEGEIVQVGKSGRYVYYQKI